VPKIEFKWCHPPWRRTGRKF